MARVTMKRYILAPHQLFCTCPCRNLECPFLSHVGVIAHL
uniref:Uncharacterized protein n=1 Tax=Anguilla anguilla TaxID=7936 RepID=A0A0E9PJ44_ANGAN